MSKITYQNLVTSLQSAIPTWEGIIKGRFSDRKADSLEPLVAELTFRGESTCHIEMQWDFDPYANIKIKIHCGTKNRGMLCLHEDSLDEKKAVALIHDMVDGMLP